LIAIQPDKSEISVARRAAQIVDYFSALIYINAKSQKNGMSALHSKRADRALKLLGAVLLPKLRLHP
jgi:hypothetical protein